MITSPKPLLYLDVDGVINAHGAPEDWPDEFFERSFTVTVPGDRRLKIRVPPGTSQRIAELEGSYEIVWATTWRFLAPTLLAPFLGFGAYWEVLEWDEHLAGNAAPFWRPRFGDVRSGNWTPKTPHIITHAAGRPLVWVDDEIRSDGLRAMVARNRQLAPSLTVIPKSSGGLADRHMAMLAEFAAGLKDRS